MLKNTAVVKKAIQIKQGQSDHRSETKAKYEKSKKEKQTARQTDKRITARKRKKVCRKIQ